MEIVFKQKKGITLIALVITIIVLLILAGISISMLSGDNSILQKATDAKTKSDEAQIKERIQLAYHSALTKDITGENGELTMPTLLEELNDEFVGKTVIITPSADNKEWTIKVDNVEETVPAGNNDTPQVATLPSTDGTKPYFPSDSFSQVEGTDLSTGLVITDKVDENDNSIGNEYVWIEVPNDGSGPDYISVTDAEDYTGIEEALIIYAGFDEDGSYTDSNTKRMSWTDEWYDSSGNNNSASSDLTATDGCGLTSTEYIELKQKMLKSIYTNGGFWIGRYEAGTDIARGDRSDSIENKQALSKVNAYPFNYVTCSQAQILANEINNIDSKYNSSLMFGIQWDLVIKHLENKGTSSSELKNASSTWGNYTYRQFTINRGKYNAKYPHNNFIDYTEPMANNVTVTDGVSWKVAKETLLTTGASDTNLKKNIYDLAGNVREWTLEHAFDSWYPCSCRGGGYNDSGETYTASNRRQHSATNSDSDVGFRISIY